MEQRFAACNADAEDARHSSVNSPLCGGYVHVATRHSLHRLRGAIVASKVAVGCYFDAEINRMINLGTIVVRLEECTPSG
jgi:hypothetical protein